MKRWQENKQKIIESYINNCSFFIIYKLPESKKDILLTVLSSVLIGMLNTE